jgi:hypothetical protein
MAETTPHEIAEQVAHTDASENPAEKRDPVEEAARDVMGGFRRSQTAEPVDVAEKETAGAEERQKSAPPAERQ